MKKEPWDPDSTINPRGSASPMTASASDVEPLQQNLLPSLPPQPLAPSLRRSSQRTRRAPTAPAPCRSRHNSAGAAMAHQLASVPLPPPLPPSTTTTEPAASHPPRSADRPRRLWRIRLWRLRGDHNPILAPVL